MRVTVTRARFSRIALDKARRSRATRTPTFPRQVPENAKCANRVTSGSGASTRSTISGYDIAMTMLHDTIDILLAEDGNTDQPKTAFPEYPDENPSKVALKHWCDVVVWAGVEIMAGKGSMVSVIGKMREPTSDNFNNKNSVQSLTFYSSR